VRASLPRAHFSLGVGQPVLPAVFLQPMIDSRRRLPHWIPDEVPIFVTWRLAGSAPRKRLDWPVAFLERDEHRDRRPIGPRWLRDPRIAKMMVTALHYGETQKLYQIHAFVVMPDHVHVVWTPRRHRSRIMEWLKGTTARRANRILGRRGRFWQDESFDHWIRNGREFDNVIGYVECNPVSAGLVASAEDWPWSSAYRDSRQDRLPHPDSRLT
jgi:REP element-mobilizing transposase RayT